MNPTNFSPYADVLLPLKIGEGLSKLTYSVPKNLQDKIQKGSAVNVSLRNRTYTGVVAELHDRALKMAAKEILAVKEGGG